VTTLPDRLPRSIAPRDWTPLQLLRALANIGLPIEAMEPLHRWDDLILIKVAAVESDARISVLDNYDFSACARIVDIGGSGLLPHLLQRQPTLRGVHFDVRSGVASARRQLKAAGVADRCVVMAGDVFEGVPLGGDIYVLSGVLHNWDDSASLRILANCRRAMAGRGRLLVIEQLLPSPIHRVGRSCERTEAYYAALLAVAGLTMTDIIPTNGRSHIIEATPS
jgi:hypothetical protein